MTPDELFEKFDTDGSGKISTDEFIAMLPQLDIHISEAKALRIFRTCDKDNSGEIDLEEFRMALFAVDPNSGNTLGYNV
jgi:calcium-binding protein CML